MSNTLSRKTFFGSCHADYDGAGFALALRRAIIPPEAVPEHSHEGAHFVLAVDAGYNSAAINNRECNAPMTLVYNPPGTVHRDCFDAENGRFMTIDIDADLVPQAIIDPFIVETQIARFHSSRVAGGLSTNSVDSIEFEDMILAIIADLKGYRSQGRKAPPWLAKAREAMADLAKDSALQIRDIAEAVDVHPVHFARVHREHFGCNPGTFLRRHRLAQAASELAEGSDLAQVAIEAGFTDQSHMTRAFRRDFATTPARFRRAFG